MSPPSVHSQPSGQEAYEVSGNPVSKEPAEKQASKAHNISSGKVEERLPHDQQVPSENSKSTTQKPDANDLGGEDTFNDAGGMAPATEGDVRDAVVGQKSGASGSEPDLASDLDRYEHCP
jgi:hypothetical protein